VGLGNERGIAWGWHDLGLVALERGQLDEAADLFSRALALFEDVGYPWAEAWARLGLGGVALRRADWSAAARELVVAARTFAELGDLTRVAQGAEGLAAVAVESGRCEDALRLLSAASSLRAGHEPGSWIAPPDGVAQRAAEALGPAPARRATEVGASMSVRATLALAESVAGSSSPPTVRRSESPLTARQRQVAALVARGDTNRQIARTLGITEKTVEMHLSQIMGRLDVRNRAQVALHAAEAGISPMAATTGSA
jgi:non-specific serine/threonine protein kinase